MSVKAVAKHIFSPAVNVTPEAEDKVTALDNLLASSSDVKGQAEW